MKTYAGIDLLSSNNYIGIFNEQEQKLYGKRIPNDLNRVLMALEAFNIQLVLAGRWFEGQRLQTAFGESCGNKAVRRPQAH